MDPQQQLTTLAAASVRDALIAEGASEVSFDPPGAAQSIVQVRANGDRGQLSASALYDLSGDGETLGRKAALEERLHAYGARDVALWTPPGARLPDDADATAGQVAEVARSLAPGQRGEVAFTVQVGIRKTGTEGSYMSVLGGLSQEWARFTNQVMGEYQLDSTTIHRLPDDEAAVTQMVDFLVLVANGLRKEGATIAVNAEDTWALQRVEGLEEPIVICAPPGEHADGRIVRRLMRRALREAGAAMDAQGPAGFRIMALATLAPGAERELATTALRGIDPTLLAGWDYLPLLVDGRVRSLLGPMAPLA